MNIEREFLHYILADTLNMNQSIIRGIQPKYLTNMELGKLYNVALQYYTAYNKKLTNGVLLSVLNKSKDLEEDAKKNILFLLDELIELKPEATFKFIVDELLAAEKERRLQIGLSKSLDLIEKKSVNDGIDSIKRMLGELEGLGDVTIIGGEYSDSIDYRQKQYKETKSQPEKGQGIMTPFPTLNYYTNGAQPGEFCLVISSTSEGKSTFLTNLAYHAYLEGSNVVYVQIEMTKEQLENRVDAIAANLPARDIRLARLGEEDEAHYYEILEAQRDIKGRFYICDIPDACTTDIIAAQIENIKMRFNPELVIVDYFDIMTAAPGEKAGGGWEERKNMAVKLKAIARKYKIALWTAAQVDAEGMRSRGESYKVSNVALTKYLPAQTDVTVSLKSTNDTVTDATGLSELVVTLLKNRNNPRGQFVIHAEISKFKMAEPEGLRKMS